MISSIRIKNLRSLKDTGSVNLKKLNILLGTNSSGKSTFIRSFPLMTQSINKNLRGFISWFDDSMVDFGSYDVAKNKYSASDECIQFEYHISNPVNIPFDILYNRHFRYRYTKLEADVSISYANDIKGTFIKRIEIKLPDISFVLRVKDRDASTELLIDQKDYSIDKWKWNQKSNGNFFPLTEYVKINDHLSSFSDWISQYVTDRIKIHCTSRLKHVERIIPLIKNWTANKNDYLTYLRIQSIRSLRNKAQKWTIDDDEFQAIYYYSSICYLINLLDVLDNELSQFYSHCSYIAPMRAESNRYYRNQGLQTDDIDAYGRNLAEFLMSLDSTQMKLYNEYCEDVLGVKVRITNPSGHHSIILKNDNLECNITDAGFGYSQVLPIVTKLWYHSTFMGYSSRRGFMSENMCRTILMEQPELHLHPAMQAKIADCFINIINGKSPDDNLMLDEDEISSTSNLSFVIETHSQAIVNRIGRRIREGKLDLNDVNIILFQKDSDNKNSILKQISFNENGQLLEWPYGFLDPED